MKRRKTSKWNGRIQRGLRNHTVMNIQSKYQEKDQRSWKEDSEAGTFIK